MENDSSDDSHDELDAEQEPEEENADIDADEDQNNNDAADEETAAQEDDQRRASKSAFKPDESWIFSPRKETLTAAVFDIVPTIAAPQGTSINALCSTPDLHWVFSGGSDGYIRKFNWIETANGKSMLTVAQRHPFVDSVTKAGVLTSYWENSDASSGKPADDLASISAVYSLAVEKHALWLLSGLEGGSINLQSVRHEEGKRISTLRGHTSAVSVLNLAADEKSCLSGSWDKNILDWDLNTGKVTRNFEGSTGQISALEYRPQSSIPVPEFSGEIVGTAPGLTTNNGAKPSLNGNLDLEANNLFGDQSTAVNGTAGSPPDSLFGGNDGDSLFGDSENVGAGSTAFDDDDNAFSKAMTDDLPAPEQEKPQEEHEPDAEGDITMEETKPSIEGTTDGVDGIDDPQPSLEHSEPTQVNGESKSSAHGDELMEDVKHEAMPEAPDASLNPGSVFLAASFDGSLRIWDKRQPSMITKMAPHNVPPWCMNACWSPDGNSIYAGRRNGSVDEYSIHTGLQKPTRNFKLPSGSGAVSAVRAMPNGRHLVCASHDILRLYDLKEQQIFKHATVPFLIIPGHRTSVVSQLFFDPTYTYMLSAAGNRGWEGSTSDVLLGYEVNVPSK